MPKKWFSARELKGLPGLPTSEAGVLRRAKTKVWKSRPRRGLGGGSEFHISNLPPETRLHIEQQEPLQAEQTKKSVADKPTRKGPGRKKRVSVNNLGERLKKARIALGKPQSEMALSVGVSIGTWQNYEIGKNVPGINVLEAITRFGIDGNWLLTGKGHPVPKEEEKPFNFPVEQITTFDELRGLVNQALNSPEKNRAHDLIFDAYTTAFSAVEDYCLFTGEEVGDEKKQILYVQLTREYLWGRNPYDGKRIIPQIIKNLFMLVKQNKAENITQPDLAVGVTGKKRKYRSFSSIDKLPTDIINDIHRMAIDPKITYEDIVSYCEQHGHKVSKSAIGRYCFTLLKEKNPEV